MYLNLRVRLFLNCLLFLKVEHFFCILQLHQITLVHFAYWHVQVIRFIIIQLCSNYFKRFINIFCMMWFVFMYFRVWNATCKRPMVYDFEFLVGYFHDIITNYGFCVQMEWMKTLKFLLMFCRKMRNINLWMYPIIRAMISFLRLVYRFYIWSSL